MANEFILLDQQLIGLQEAIVQEMRKLAPVETGRLKRSIKPQPIIDTPQGLQAPIKYVQYGRYPDFGTKYQKAQRFTERSQEKVVAQQQNAIGEAAGKDVLNALDLPKEIDLTLQV
jgi:HK97 gp10 family phage protein